MPATPAHPLDQRYKHVRLVALDWFRDDTGCDETVIDGLSIGTTLSCALWQGLSAICHYAHLYSGQDPHDGFLHLPQDSSRLRRQVARHFGEIRLDEPPTGELHVDEQYLVPEMLHVPRVATWVRRAQRPLRSFVRRRKNLYITDWVTARASRSDPDGLVLFRRSWTRTAVPHSTSAERTWADGYYPENIDHLLTHDRLQTCLLRHDLEFSRDECDLFLEYSHEIYREMRPSLVRATAQYENMLAFYQPEHVYLPSDGFETWNIVYQLCRRRGITTHMCVDGYMCVPLWPAQRTPEGTDWLVDRAVAYGTAQRRHIETTGFPADRIDVAEPPFLQYLSAQTEAPQEYDVIVLTWIPYTVNPQADYTSPIRTLRSALQVLHGMGLTRIAVKVKSSREIPYVRHVAAGLDIEVDVLTGRFYEHVRRAPLVLGGISTALAETIAVGNRYVVYEPFENGYPDEMISQSCVMTRETIARNEVELTALIASGTNSWVGDRTMLTA